jgi:hypothetical protein
VRRHRRGLYALVVVACLAQMAVAMVTTAVRQTPTIDEPVYVGTAVVYLQQHSLRYNPEHPPLGKLIIGAGAAVTGPRLDPAADGSQSAVGQRLLYESGNDPWRLMLLARLPMILLTLAFAVVAFRFAREVAGPAGGLVAVALYTFAPDLIAHGSLATLDVPAAGFLLTSLWLLWRARRRPLRHLPLAGLALGAALATKMSALPAVPVVAALVVLSVWCAGRAGAAGRGRGAGAWPAARRVAAGGLAAVGVVAVAVLVVWGSYLAVDPRLDWTAPVGVPVISGWPGRVIDLLPFPAPFRDGVRVQLGYEDGGFGGYLFGDSYVGSKWYYLPAALLVKTPLGALVLWLAGSAAMVTVPRPRRAAPYLLLPAVVLLGAAMTGSRDFGVRYVIVLPMVLAVVAAAVMVVRRRWVRVAAVGLVLCVAASSLRTFPYYLPYSNEAFGGPSRTHLHLHDSNVDWGQDLGRLADRLRERYPDERVWLVYKGSGVPSYYGIEAADPLPVPPDRVHGLLVVSNSFVARPDARLAALIDSSEPIDQVGHSITIYRRAPPG